MLLLDECRACSQSISASGRQQSVAQQQESLLGCDARASSADPADSCQQDWRMQQAKDKLIDALIGR